MPLCVVAAAFLFLKCVRKLVGNNVVAFLEGKYVKVTVGWDFIAHLTLVKEMTNESVLL